MILTLKPELPMEICRRMAVHLDDEVRLRGIKSLAVADEFQVKTRGGATRLGSFPLPRFLAAQIRTELRTLAKKDPQYSVSLDMPNVSPKALGGSSEPSANVGPEATVFGELSLLDRGIGIQCELFAKGEPWSSPVASSTWMRIGSPTWASRSTSPATPARTSKRRTSTSFSRRPERRTRCSTTNRRLASRFTDFSTSTRRGCPSTMTSPKNRPSYPRLPGQGPSSSRTPEKLLVPAEPGERFMIRVQNRSEMRVGVSLLVDGINTMGKRPELAGRGSVWIMEPKSQIDVQGWFGEPATGAALGKQNVQASWFVFKDVAESLAQRLNSTEKVGLITASFYAEGKTGRGLGVGEMLGGTAQLQVKSFVRGPMLATINLGYADARELKRLAAQ